MIQGGRASIMLAGAVEAPLSPLTFGSFCLVGILSTQNSPPFKTPKPFDKNRDGIVLSEGGAVLFLEELHHALSVCEILTYQNMASFPHLSFLNRSIVS